MDGTPDDDDKKRDEILKRMLGTPPQPHKKGAGDTEPEHSDDDRRGSKRA